MFYDLVKRNSKRNRKENGLFFISLIVSIVAFYIILSLEKQDVIIFLKTMESQALDKLFLLIPVLYGLSLFILFFLVSHDLGEKVFCFFQLDGFRTGKNWLLWKCKKEAIVGKHSK